MVPAGSRDPMEVAHGRGDPAEVACNRGEITEVMRDRGDVSMTPRGGRYNRCRVMDEMTNFVRVAWHGTKFYSMKMVFIDDPVD